MYQVFPTKSFLKSVKRISYGVGGNKIIEDLNVCIDHLIKQGNLPRKYIEHNLYGEYLGYKECHIRGDCLLVYKVDHAAREIDLVELGSHSYLF